MMVRIFIILFFWLTLPVHAEEKRLLVFAAASMRDVLQVVGEEYEKTCDCRVVFSFAASSTLARQIDNGAPVDVFISANRPWIDWLKSREQLIAHEPAVFAGNRLVVASKALTRDSFNILQRGRFSMADPASVPAGIYAKQALDEMELWEHVKTNAVFTENVRVALAMVARGDLLSGIVYSSDLKAAKDLHAHFTFDETSHDKIEYLAAIPKRGSENSSDFINYLLSDDAQKTLSGFGFLLPSATTSK